MVSRYFQRPENVKKRALELLDVGKRERALDILYDFIRRGRHRQHNSSEKELEPILFMYLDLCVELKKSHSAKEGLFQYRNFCQNVNVASLENVVRGYLNNAEQKTDAARKESKEAVEDVDDLENIVSPQEVLLSAVSSEDSQDRSDRTILTPWVKFLWESYRQCLELLKNNSRVESLYHDTALQAFRFCAKYQRKTEFRKLFEILRKHLDQLKLSSSTNISLTNPETLARNMETWLAMLDHAIALEMWQEAYRAIYELHGLMTRSKSKPKAQMMANYFSKLSLVFAKAGNMLFHAASVLRLFQLSRDLKKNLSQEDLKLMACRVLLAVLAIPLTASHLEYDRFVETEKNVLDKSERLASFFRMPKVPTRESLLKDMARFSIMPCVSGTLRQLYHVMEVAFDPLGMCQHVHRLTDSLLADPSQSLLHWYIEPLHQVAQLRFIKQMGQVYRSVSLNRLVQLCPFTDHYQLQRIIVDAVRRSQLQIRIDHRQQAIYFGSDLSEFQREDVAEGPTLQQMPSEQIRCQLMLMCGVLNSAQKLVMPDYKKSERAEMRAAIHHSYHQSKKREHERVCVRQTHIEEHKERMEHINSERVQEERSRQEQQEKQKLAEEMRRLEREATEREKKRREGEIKQIAAKNLKTRIAQISQTSVGQKVISKLDEEELLKMNADEIMARQVEELEKERREQAQKLATQWRRIDHTERAKRLEEIPLLQANFDKQNVEDAALWQEEQKSHIAHAIEEHEQAVKHKARLSRMLEDKDMFVDMLKSARKHDFESKLASFQAKLAAVKEERLEERRRERVQERRARWLEERKEEQQRRRDEEAKRLREEQEREQRERQEAEAAEYRRQREEREAITAKQMAKELEMEEKMARRYEAPAPASAAAGSGGGWREREAKRSNDWRPTDARDRGEAEPAAEPWRRSDAGRRDPPRRTYDSPRPSEDSWRRREEDPRRMEGGPRRMDDGPRRMDDGPRRIDDGPRRIDDGPRRVDDGPRRMDDGPRRMDDGPRRMDDGPKRMDGGAWRMDDRPRRVEDESGRREDGARNRNEPWRTDDRSRRPEDRFARRDDESRGSESSWRGDPGRRSMAPRRFEGTPDAGPRRFGSRHEDDDQRRGEGWRRDEPSWRRGGDDRDTARDTPRRQEFAPPPKQSPWRRDAPKKEEKNEEDEDGGWTTVRH